jgi:hypothetical protein
MASSSTRKGAPTGLRLQRPGGGSAGGGEPLHSAGGGWSSGLSVDTGDRGASPNPAAFLGILHLRLAKLRAKVSVLAPARRPDREEVALVERRAVAGETALGVSLVPELSSLSSRSLIRARALSSVLYGRLRETVADATVSLCLTPTLQSRPSLGRPFAQLALLGLALGFGLLPDLSQPLVLARLLRPALASTAVTIVDRCLPVAAGPAAVAVDEQYLLELLPGRHTS